MAAARAGDRGKGPGGARLRVLGSPLSRSLRRSARRRPRAGALAGAPDPEERARALHGHAPACGQRIRLLEAVGEGGAVVVAAEDPARLHPRLPEVAVAAEARIVVVRVVEEEVHRLLPAPHRLRAVALDGADVVAAPRVVAEGLDRERHLRVLARLDEVDDPLLADPGIDAVDRHRGVD